MEERGADVLMPVVCGWASVAGGNDDHEEERKEGDVELDLHRPASPFWSAIRV